MLIDQLQERAYESVKHFYDVPDVVKAGIEKLAEEAREVEMEALTGRIHEYSHTGAPIGIAVELADIVLVSVAMMRALNIDAAKVIREKLEYNERRTDWERKGAA